MNWKLIFLGGLAMYIVMFAVSLATGLVIHEQILEPLYIQNSEFWRPELNVDPPDMAALMPRWISMGLLTSFVFAGIFGVVRSAFAGPGWQRGLKFGVILALMNCCFAIGYSGIFNLPDSIWAWWSVESFFYFLPAAAVLGWLGDKFD